MVTEVRFDKVLVANRGEVAIRIIDACRKCGISSVAVYSEPDRNSLHVSRAGEAVALAGSTPGESYLDQQQIIDAALATGADAIHPGYGFLSENPQFAQKCTEAGITFIGPDTRSMVVMASKSQAKELVMSLDIPVIPGANPSDQSPESLAKAAQSVGYPVLIKASAGGGGMGMRVVNSADEFAWSLAAAQREAKAAFDDDHMLLERYFSNIRHIEVQIIADMQGTTLHCYERECSIQRRRQKVVEEAPSPTISASLRNSLTEAAVAIARSVDYRGLGTVEFIVEDHTDNFYFLEMNTRLQVEHGITEAITGLDLVQLQIGISEGQPLNLSQQDIPCKGHAIECRLYAEDPSCDFTPATGEVLRWAPYQAQHTRIDSCIATGSTISSYYDPMIAKLVTWGEDRGSAIRNMRRTLQCSSLLGVTTNQHFLECVIGHKAFLAGDTTTEFIPRHHKQLQPTLTGDQQKLLLMVAAFNQAQSQLADCPPGQSLKRVYRLCVNSGEFLLHVGMVSSEQAEIAFGEDAPVEVSLLQQASSGAQLIEIGGHSRWYHIAMSVNEVFISSAGLGTQVIGATSRFAVDIHSENEGDYCSEMPGRIIDVLVHCGSKVKAGDKLLTMESMKMEHSKLALTDGVVNQLYVAVGDVVEKNAVLIDIEQVVA